MPTDITYAPWCPRFVHGTGGDLVTLDMSLPSREWAREVDTIGGRRIAAAGSGASFIVRTDHLIVVPLRFYETEWPDVWAMLEWGQTEEPLTYYPDQNVLGTSFSVYLHSPEAGVRLSPTRMPDYPRVLELSITLRPVTLDEPWSIDYHPEP